MKDAAATTAEGKPSVKLIYKYTMSPDPLEQLKSDEVVVGLGGEYIHSYQASHNIRVENPRDNLISYFSQFLRNYYNVPFVEVEYYMLLY